MALKLNTAPTTEPVSLSEVRAHLRIDSQSFADDMTSVQSIAPGSHAIAASYSLVGTSVDVLGYSALVLLESGTNGTGGTVDVKLQDSDDNSTWADVTSGAFTQVTTANDNATYEKAYTGGKQYLRVVCTVGTATCDFGVSILTDAPTGSDDDLLNALITTARQHVENTLRRSLITQTWELWMETFPSTDYIEIPLPPLISVSSITYYDVDDTVATMDADEYFVDVKSEPGRVSLNDGESWPSTTLRPHNGVCITFVSGYGAAASVPKAIKQAILLLISHLYENREAVTTSGGAPNELPFAVNALLYPYRIWGFSYTSLGYKQRHHKIELDYRRAAGDVVFHEPALVRGNPGAWKSRDRIRGIVDGGQPGDGGQ